MELKLKPVRNFPFVFWAGYSFLFFIIQLLQGTSIIFASNILFFNLCWGFACNLLGGLATVEGWLVLLFGLRHVGISQFAKMFLGQAADTGLDDPELTGMVYSWGILSVLIVSGIVSKFNLAMRGYVKPHTSESSSFCHWVVFGIGMMGMAARTIQARVSVLYLLPILNLLTYFQPLTFLGLIYSLNKTLKQSHGRYFLNLSSAIMLLVCFGYGAVEASKQYMFEPIMVVFLTFVFGEFVVKTRHLVWGGLVVFLVVNILTPLSNHGRYDYRKESFSDTIPSLIDYLYKNFSSLENYASYRKSIENTYEESDLAERSYYGKSYPLLERFSLIHDADNLIANYKFREHEGFAFFWDRVHLLPRSLTGKWIKDDDIKGDELAKISGLISEDNDSTAVSFGFIAEGFAIFGWWGGIVAISIPLLLYLIMVRSLDIPSGDRVWTIFLIVFLQHTFSETGVINMVLFTVRLLPLLIILKKLLEVLEQSTVPRRKHLLRSRYA